MLTQPRIMFSSISQSLLLCFGLFWVYLHFLTHMSIFTVSAFYAECFSKKIQFNAHIWTKSKFLGMSIGVHNIGQGKH